MKILPVTFWLSTLCFFSIVMGCPTCVGRADKTRPLFFSTQSYTNSPPDTFKSMIKKRYATLRNKSSRHTIEKGQR